MHLCIFLFKSFFSSEEESKKCEKHKRKKGMKNFRSKVNCCIKFLVWRAYNCYKMRREEENWKNLLGIEYSSVKSSLGENAWTDFFSKTIASRSSLISFRKPKTQKSWKLKKENRMRTKKKCKASSYMLIRKRKKWFEKNERGREKHA